MSRSFSRAVRHEALHRRVRLQHRQDLPGRQSSGIFVGNSGPIGTSAQLRRTEIAMGGRDSPRLLHNGSSQLRRDFPSQVCFFNRVFRPNKRRERKVKKKKRIIAEWSALDSSARSMKCEMYMWNIHVAYIQVLGIAREERQKGAAGRVACGKQDWSLLLAGWARGIRPRRPKKGKRNRGSRFPRDFCEGIGRPGKPIRSASERYVFRHAER